MKNKTKQFETKINKPNIIQIIKKQFKIKRNGEHGPTVDGIYFANISVSMMLGLNPGWGPYGPMGPLWAHMGRILLRKSLNFMKIIKLLIKI